MSIFNSLQFDDIDSLQYGIYITGEAQYNAPERDVTMVEVAGRNGEVIIDNGRWKNIEVTYHCGCFGEDQEGFASKIRAFRSMLASKIGYKRLADTYHLDEYRMGAFTAPVEVESVSYNRAGEFDITFNCKPQRWLTSGETAVTVSDGDTLTNPTPYDASPLLAVEGYGTIGFNGYEIEIENATLGEVELASSLISSKTFSNGAYNDGDTITVKNLRVYVSAGTSFNVNNFSTNNSNASFTTQSSGKATRKVYFTVKAETLTFTAGTSSTVTNTVLLEILDSLEVTRSRATISIRLTYTPNSSTGKDEFALTVTATDTGTVALDTLYATSNNDSAFSIVVDSTQSLLGDPTYIDCDLGDAYMIKDGSYISLNSYIDLGSDLPTLASGANEVTLDNTITELTITPRYWIL